MTSTHTTTNTTSQNNNKDFTTVEFNDVTVDYDGKSHTITPTGVPYDAHYSYTSTNSYVDASTDEGYTISIKVYGSNYNTKYMSAKLVIKPLNFGNLVFEDKIYQYDTKEHSIEVSNLPSNATTTYKCLNKNGITNKATNIGEYNIEATVSLKNYKTTTLSATLSILDTNFVSIDTSKTNYKFNSGVTYIDLLNEFKKGNYTVDITYESVCNVVSTGQVYQTTLFSKTIVGVNDDVYTNRYTSYSGGSVEYVETKTAIKNGEYVISCKLDQDNNVRFYKSPVLSFKETYQRLGYFVMDLFKVDSLDGLLVLKTDKGVNEFSISNNSLTIVKHDYHYHNNDTGVNEPIRNDERLTYVFSNIGNTKVDIHNLFKGNVNDVGSYIIEDFYLDSIHYLANYVNFTYKNYTARLELNSCDLLILDNKKTFTLYGGFFNLVDSTVTSLEYKSTYDYAINDLTGYTINTFYTYDSATSGTYAGEYASCGTLTTKGMKDWLSYGGAVKYYGEW